MNRKKMAGKEKEKGNKVYVPIAILKDNQMVQAGNSVQEPVAVNNLSSQ